MNNKTLRKRPKRPYKRKTNQRAGSTTKQWGDNRHIPDWVHHLEWKWRVKPGLKKSLY